MRKLRKRYEADDLAARLLNLPHEFGLCMLDSCGVSHLGSRYMIAGVLPKTAGELSDTSAAGLLSRFNEICDDVGHFVFFTIGYEFGGKLERIADSPADSSEPDLFYAIFETVVIHDYQTLETYLVGSTDRFDELESVVSTAQPLAAHEVGNQRELPVFSNLERDDYVRLVLEIKERIRRGDTYQTNLTQQLTATLPDNLTPPLVFSRLRKTNPAPFAAFIRRADSVVVSASPERFFKVTVEPDGRMISTSPIKGTRPRGDTPEADHKLRVELSESAKDRAENVMIVDLLRNDIGRICEFGSVGVEKLCDLEEHPTLFHLVSTVTGRLREDVRPSDILRALFPCGSITGAPKISTMKIISELEKDSRGLSMGAIGLAGPSIGGLIAGRAAAGVEIDTAVAIRTMTIRGKRAFFNVGGGVVIDSDAEKEYHESLLKAAALLAAINGKLFQEQTSVSGV